MNFLHPRQGGRSTTMGLAALFCAAALVPGQQLSAQHRRANTTSQGLRLAPRTGSITTLHALSIAPIAPMHPLFGDGDFFRSSWSGARMRRSPVRLGPQETTIAQRSLRQPLREVRASSSALLPTAQNPPSLPSRVPVDLTYPLPPSRMEALEPVEAVPLAQSEISPARAAQIQAALAKFGYLASGSTGAWDASSAAAMRKLQVDHHWQTKFVPDARALILLGLGPGSVAHQEEPRRPT